MTAKEYLKQVWPLKREITVYLQELEYWRTLAENITGNTLEEHYNPNRSESAPYEHCIDKILEIQQKLDEAVTKLASMTSYIMSRYEKMTSQERLLIQYRYMEDFSWERIETLMNISERTALRIHGKALKKFEKNKSWQ